MTGQIVYIGDNADLISACRCEFERTGYELLDACQLSEAQDLLDRVSVDILCIDSHLFNAEAGEVIAASLKKKTSHVPVMLIHSGGDAPERYEEFVDVVMTEQDFAALGHQMDRLRRLRFPVFVDWFDDWKRRGS